MHGHQVLRATLTAAASVLRLVGEEVVPGEVGGELAGCSTPRDRSDGSRSRIGEAGQEAVVLDDPHGGPPVSDQVLDLVRGRRVVDGDGVAPTMRAATSRMWNSGAFRIISTTRSPRCTPWARSPAVARHPVGVVGEGPLLPGVSAFQRRATASLFSTVARNVLGNGDPVA